LRSYSLGVRSSSTPSTAADTATALNASAPAARSTKISCARPPETVVSSIAAGTHGVTAKSSVSKSISGAQIR
jgi:hypothetical protein